jgi:hypothetical protein
MEAGLIDLAQDAGHARFFLDRSMLVISARMCFISAASTGEPFP